MMPHCDREQYELFEHPTHEAQRPPKLALPFQRAAEINPKRAAKILDVSLATVQRMIDAGLIHAIKIDGERRPRIEYDSLVDYCNRLRLEYRIPASLLPKLQGRRHRDEILLPFPPRDTIGVAAVQQALECTRETAIYLIEIGKLVAYQIFIGGRGGPWRIQRQSLERYIDSHQAPKNPPSRQVPPSRL